MIKETVYYRKPACVGRVRGRRDVGQDGDGRYMTEASVDPQFGAHVCSGSGDTPEEARRVAYGRLARALDDYMNCRD